jgi:hypothetical protein
MRPLRFLTDLVADFTTGKEPRTKRPLAATTCRTKGYIGHAVRMSEEHIGVRCSSLFAHRKAAAVPAFGVRATMRSKRLEHRSLWNDEKLSQLQG